MSSSLATGVQSSWQGDILAIIREQPQPMDGRPKLAVFDVDLTVANGLLASMDGFKIRSGIVPFINELHDLGILVAFWSGGGEEHADEVACEAGVRHLLIGTFRKPPLLLTNEGGMSPEDTMALLGQLPACIVDDDPSERVAGAGFFHIEPFMDGFA